MLEDVRRQGALGPWRDLRTEEFDRLAEVGEGALVDEFALDLVALHGNALDIVGFELRDEVTERKGGVFGVALVQEQEKGDAEGKEEEPAEQPSAESHPTVIGGP